MLLTVNVMRRVPWHDMGIRFRVSDGDLMSLLALVLPLTLFLSKFLCPTHVTVKRAPENNSASMVR